MTSTAPNILILLSNLRAIALNNSPYLLSPKPKIAYFIPANVIKRELSSRASHNSIKLSGAYPSPVVEIIKITNTPSFDIFFKSSTLTMDAEHTTAYMLILDRSTWSSFATSSAVPVCEAYTITVDIMFKRCKQTQSIKTINIIMKTTQLDKDPLEEEQNKELEPTGVTLMGDSTISFQKRRAIRSRQTVRPKTQNVNRSYYEDIKEKMKKLEMPLWNNSATSWFRNVSPSHCIPKAQRFTSLDKDMRRNRQFLKLNLASEIKNMDKGRKFPLSKRINHFLDKNKMDQPSPANYQTHRFLDNSSYKIADKANSFTTLPSHNSCTIKKQHQKDNPQMTFHYENTNHTVDEFQLSRFDELRGRTIYKFDKYHKQYLDHGKQFAYNQHYGQGIPGVGAYVVDQPIGRQKASFSMRKVLYRFNQRIKASPGPSDYKNDPKPAKPSTLKQTITNSRRLDLAKPLNTTPGPAFYSISRYLEKSS